MQQTDPYIIAHSLMDYEFSGELRKSGEYYTDYLHNISQQMSTPFGKMVMLLHENAKADIEREFPERPQSREAEKACIRRSLDRIIHAFEEGGYKLNDHISSSEDNRLRPGNVVNRYDPRFTVSSLVQTVDVMTSRRYRPEGLSRAAVYEQDIDRLIAFVKRTSLWEAVEGKMRHIENNNDGHISAEKCAIYAAQYPRLKKAWAELSPKREPNLPTNSDNESCPNSGVVVEFPSRPSDARITSLAAASADSVERYG